ncbi:tyrosyl-DNA phosphodiesterase-domain-containing protein [Phaeosphaeria sp. MPI-PUGE-AT-0046c]|nr:tyrosyl-DNA phosphodiesterase-domain-containing protein [Phaeosphaeria sp. MPI-PUGE-AT-0046c]
MGHDVSEPHPKRRKLSIDTLHDAEVAAEQLHHDSPKKGLDKPISPPLSRRKSPAIAGRPDEPAWKVDNVPNVTRKTSPDHFEAERDRARGKDEVDQENMRYLPSPFQLTHIRDMAARENVDAVQLGDILGDPLIKECWNFNYLFNVDFVMNQFDSDVRDLVKVKIIHGFWKNEDKNRIALLEAAERFSNVELLSAYIPDPFGTHHSKMLVLFRHDDQAQVIIHTANMIARDWGNMTQAVWCSPLLPLCKNATTSEPASTPDTITFPIGSGERFKLDLLRYFRAYGKRISSMTDQLTGYDFSAIRAAFIGSAPSRQKPAAARSSEQTSFGWLGLQEILSSVPISITSGQTTSRPHVVMQVSSIATLGAAPTWLSHLQSVLSRSAPKAPSLADTTDEPTKAPSFFDKTPQVKTPRPSFNIIFPAPSEIRNCLDGYAAGGSIHIKLQSAQQQKQLEYLHPLFCHWTASSPPSTSFTLEQRRGQALRGPAAPHIKTYVRFSDLNHKTIDWAMVTSANLSKQAWGDVVNKKDEIWIQSWEAGVVVWPALFTEGGKSEGSVMVPVFGKDMPGRGDVCGGEESMDEEENGKGQAGKTVVGFRMPYDLPLSPYAVEDRPWCATMQYAEPDRFGFGWGGY